MKADLIFEVWKPVPNYEGLYDASNFGRVKNVSLYYKNQFGVYPKKEKTILCQSKNNSGYMTVRLCKDGKEKRFLVHRLVYEVFNGPIPRGMQINHINEIKTDNSVWNLNLMTPKENQNYGRCNLKKKKHVFQYTFDLHLVREYDSLTDVSKYGFNMYHVSSCCLGKRRHHKGFLWSYVPL